jgi:hypothetical protein
MKFKNSEEQRKTARRTAVFSTSRRPRLKDFCGEGQIRR